MTDNAKHSSKSESHMTPEYIVEAARETLGGFDLDPATTKEANGLVKAHMIFTSEENGLEQTWEMPKLPGQRMAAMPSRVLLNPPGGAMRKAETIEDPARWGYTKSRQALWWLKLMIEFEKGHVKNGVFIGFSIEFLQVAQGLKCYSPTDFPMCIPMDRIPFDKWDDDGKRVSQKQPSHANVIVLVPHDDEDIERFRKAFRPLGEVFNDHV